MMRLESVQKHFLGKSVQKNVQKADVLEKVYVTIIEL